MKRLHHGDSENPIVNAGNIYAEITASPNFSNSHIKARHHVRSIKIQVEMGETNVLRYQVVVYRVYYMF